MGQKFFIRVRSRSRPLANSIYSIDWIFHPWISWDTSSTVQCEITVGCIICLQTLLTTTLWCIIWCCVWLNSPVLLVYVAGTINLDLVGGSLVAWNIVLDFFLLLRPNPRHKIEWTWRLIRKVLKAQKVAVEDLVYRGLVPFRHDSLARVSKGSFQMVESCIQFHAVTSNILHYLWWWNHTKAACWLP